MSSRSDEPARDRVLELDLLRFVAASMVLFYHLTFFGFAASRLSPVPFESISAVSRYGGLGVNLFFIISGFVILMSAQRCTPAQFVVSRAVRLYPAYWACCTATYIGLLGLPHPQFTVSFSQYLANLTMVSPLAGIDFIDGVYWSLLVELKFYLLIFLVLGLGLLRHTRAFLGVWLAVSWLAQLHLVETHVTNLLFLTDWSGYFIAGAMFYCVRQRGRWDAYSTAVVSLSCLLAVQRALVAAAVESNQLGEREDAWIVAGVLVGFFALFAVLASGRRSRLYAPGVVTLGGLTYPLYLLHQRIGYVVLKRVGPGMNKYALLACLITGIVGAAYVAHRYMERPIQRRLRSVLDARLGSTLRRPPADTQATSTRDRANQPCD